MTIAFMATEKSKRIMAESLASFGWDIEKGRRDNIEATAGPRVFLIDVETGNLILKVGVNDAFSILEQDANLQHIPFDFICSDLSKFFVKLRHNKNSFDKTQHELMTILSFLYIKATSCFQIAKAKDIKHPQYIIMYQEDHKTKEGLLRPFAINAKDLLTPNELEEICRQVLSVDMRNHPERFASADILKFKLKNQ